MKKFLSVLTGLALTLSSTVALGGAANAAPVAGGAVTVDSSSASHTASNTSRKIVVAPNGDIFILYKSGSALKVAKSTNDGASFSAGVEVVASASEGEIAISSSGTLHVTWKDMTTIYQKKSFDNGATWSAAVTVATGITSGVGSGVHTAVDREYVYAISSSGQKVYSSADSGDVWRPTDLSSTSWAFSDILTDPLTGRVYAFVDNPSVSWFASTDRGVTFSSERETGKQVYFSVAAISSNATQKYLFMAGADTNLERLNLNTNQVDTFTVEEATSSQSRAIAADGLGNVISASISGTDFKYQISNDFGATFSAATSIEGSLTSTSFGGITINPTNGDVLFTWSKSNTVYFEKLSGALVGYDLQLDITNVDFDAAGNKTVTITNVGSASATVTVELSNTVFTQTNTCTGSLAPMATCTVTITAATAGSALLKVSAGGVDRLIPVAFGASSATVEAETFTDGGSSVVTPPYTGPIVDPRSGSVAAGQKVLLTGKNLTGVSKVTIDGKDALVKVLSAESIEITVPAGIATGTYDLVVTSTDGVLTAQAILTVGASSNTGAAKSSMKRSADGILRVRVFEPVGAGKIQVFFNGKEIAWVNATSSADAKLTNGYLVRTLNLVEGKNVVEVFVDGKRVDRKAYTN